MKNCLLVSLLSLSMGVNSLHAQGKFSGDMIGEFYYVAQHHSDSFIGHNGFWFRKSVSLTKGL